MVVDKPRVLIIGGGMAGLTAAYTLHYAAPGAFHLRVAEASHRLGGRIHSTTFSGVLVELGATWIHGISGSPVHDLARRIGALDSDLPHERMDDGFRRDPITALPGGDLVDPHLVGSISSLYRSLSKLARSPSSSSAPTHDDLSLGAFLRRGLHAYRASPQRVALRSPHGDRTLDSLEDALFAMRENLERISTSASDLAAVDLAAEREYRDFPGKHVSIPRGYSRVIEHLASELSPGTVEHGKKAEKISWRPDGQSRWTSDDGGPAVRVHFEGGEIAAVDHVIVTVSLGVLKAEGEGLFDPELPEFQRDAIRRLGFGVVDKLFLEWEADEGGDFPYLQMVAAEAEAEAVTTWMRRTPSLWPVYAGARVLLAWFAGEEAEEMEGTKEEEVVRGANATIRAFAPSVKGEVRRVRRSRWGSDPLFRGSYSYVAVGSSGEDLDRIAEPLPRGVSGAYGRLQVMFAGEATHRTHYSTTHGAYLSGVREGNRLLRHYNLLRQ